MTKQEIKELISRYIEGQGNQIDSGGKLPTILNEILDALDTDSKEYAKLVEVDDSEDFDESTAYQIGDIVRYEGGLNKFTADKEPGPWDESKVEKTNVVSIILDVIGDLSLLKTDVKTSIVSALNELFMRIEDSPSVTISALQSANLTAEQAAAAGFTANVITYLQQAHKPTIEFSDMCVSFNAVEVISDDLVNQSTIIVHTAVGGGTLYKAILSLYTDGRLVYTVTEIQ